MTVSAAHLDDLADEATHIDQCRVCGCTDDNATECVERTGHPCHWVEPGLCSACALVG